MDLTTTRAPVARVPWRPIVLVALMTLLLVALLAVYAGSQRHVPPPFGPAANGVIPFSANGDILVGDPITGQSHVVVGGPQEDYSPSFSSDGTLIGFLRGVSDNVETIVVTDEHGGNATTLSAQGFAYVDYAQWVPGRHAILVAYLKDGRRRLELLDATGAAAPKLLLDDARVIGGQYRPPTGDELVIEALIDGTWGLYSMRSDGTGLHLLAPARADVAPGDDPGQDLNFISYSPDGSKIYYNRYTPEAETIQAWVMNADGTDQHRFDRSGPPCCWWEGEMAPSPDGKSVVMWRVPPDGGPNIIALFPADGSGDGVPIGPQVAGTAQWVWAPDSTRLLMNYNEASEGPMQLIDPTTGTWNALPWSQVEPDWQRKAP